MGREIFKSIFPIVTKNMEDFSGLRTKHAGRHVSCVILFWDMMRQHPIKIKLLSFFSEQVELLGTVINY